MNETAQNSPKSTQLMGKLIVLAVLVTVSWVATMFVWATTQDRQSRQESASAEISEQWSRPQTISGPVITIPVETTTVSASGERMVSASTITLLPRKLSYESKIKSQLLSRGVYETPVYTTTISGAGDFDVTGIALEDSSSTRIIWNKAIISLNVSDTRGVSSMFELNLNGEKYQMVPSSDFSTLDSSGMHANIMIDPNKPDYVFSFEMPLKGSREISFLPLGEDTSVVVDSDWSAPNFIGKFLPEERSITENGFNAVWNITSYGKNLPQYWFDNSSTVTNELLLSKSFGVALYQEVDFYTMIDRAIKYSILFISLTFLTFFMYEILAGLRIHPMQYLLVGFGIAIFYLLLLSFAEIVGFLSAYLLASAATTGLITSYSFSFFRVRKRVFTIAALLVSLYCYLYILLQMDQYSLLFGSVLLFGVLSTVMYITRNLDWYSLNTK